MAIKERKSPCLYDWSDNPGWIYDIGSSSPKSKKFGDINLKLVTKLHKQSNFEYLSEMFRDNLLTGSLLAYYMKLRNDNE